MERKAIRVGLGESLLEEKWVCGREARRVYTSGREARRVGQEKG